MSRHPLQAPELYGVQAFRELNAAVALYGQDDPAEPGGRLIFPPVPYATGVEAEIFQLCDREEQVIIGGQGITDPIFFTVRQGGATETIAHPTMVIGLEGAFDPKTGTPISPEDASILYEDTLRIVNHLARTAVTVA